MSVALLMASMPVVGSAQSTGEFTDVGPGHVFVSDIAWLADEGITRGCNPPANDRFCPDDPVTRGQMAAFLVRALGLPAGTGTFTDTTGHVFEGDIARLAAADITRGCNPPQNDQFCPDDLVTRGQMAAFLYRALSQTDEDPPTTPPPTPPTTSDPVPPPPPTPPPLNVDTQLPEVHVFHDYNASLEITGGTPPYQIEATNVPPGLRVVGSNVLRDSTAPLESDGVHELSVTVEDADGNTLETTVEVEVIGVQQIAAGYDHACAITTDTAVYCWGRNTSGQLGDGTFTDRDRPVQVVHPDQEDSFLTGAVDIDAKTAHTCVVTEDGAAYCWGFNGGGRLGLGHEILESYNVPGRVVAPVGDDGYLTGVVQIRTGEIHTCALTEDTLVYCWGDNLRGQLGRSGHTGGTPASVVDPTNTDESLTGVVDIGLGSFHTCAITADTTGLCWGWNNVGQLGNGETTGMFANPVPRVVVDPEDPQEPLTGLAHVDGGGVHTCAGTADGASMCWGQNAHGQLGNGDEPNNSSVPVNVVDPDDPTQPLAGTVATSTGVIHSCALTEDGTALCWGNNEEGQLGDGSTDTTGVPVVVADPTEPSSAFSGLSQLADYGWNTCAVTSGGIPYCWGDNQYGQIGDGTTTDRSLPEWVRFGS
ncbi:MAG TPA: S-layer homology domain-containing protein [Acidimicrobiia bacterium]|nr:S-layer homology domain-containing protein [Acidimicrobiia bacterium]